MLDYLCKYPDGRLVPISEMPTADILDELGLPGMITFGPSEDLMRQRLEIELLIRKMGLR